jgi:hypothetical protein
MRGIGAEADIRLRARGCLPQIATSRCHSLHRHAVGQKTELRAAIDANAIVEVNGISAIAAFVKSHEKWPARSMYVRSILETGSMNARPKK